jgi:integrase
MTTDELPAKTARVVTARACMFIAYTGLRRREGTQLKRTDMLTENALEFKSKTRSLRVPLSKQALALLDLESEGPMLRVTEFQLRKPLIRIFGERETSRGKKACVTPHDLRRYFKSVGTELGIDPTIMDLLVGHAIKGVNKSYIAKLRRSVLLAATQKIADEIDNPQEPADDEIIVSAKQVA